MPGEAQSGRIYHRLRRWILLLGCLSVLPVLAFLLSNLALSSPWARHKLAGKIRGITGLETEIGNASWAPWSGVSLKQITIKQPPELRSAISSPMVKIESLKITPVWPAWLKRRFEMRSITLVRPVFVLPVGILTRPLTPAIAEPPPPTLATAPPPRPAAPPPPPLAKQPPPTPVPAPRIAQPTGMIYLTDASFSVVSASQALFAATKISGAIPVAGDAAETFLHIGELTAVGKIVAQDLRAQLAWQAPFLTLKPMPLTFDKITATLAMQLGMLSGLPIQISAQVPGQAFPAISLPRHGEAQAESIAMEAGFHGLLLAPSTWQGDCIAKAVSPRFRSGEHYAMFDYGRAVTVLRSGQISCLDARLMSDELSILGNATIASNGSAAAICRIVAAPQRLETISRIIFPTLQDSRLTPLNTPQRAAFDLAVFGNVPQLFLQAGKDGPVVNLIF